MDNLQNINQTIMHMQTSISNAQHTADRVALSVSAHEILCAERYKNIQDRMSAIPRLFEMLEKTRNMVYIGVGIWVGVPAFLGLLYTVYSLYQMIAKV